MRMRPIPEKPADLSRVGWPCEDCGVVVRVVEIDCRGRRERGEPLARQEICRCNHPGDLLCNCGDPCWTFF